MSTNLSTTRKVASKELLTELGMRAKVWKRVPGTADRFMDMRQQQRYDIMDTIYEVLEIMTDAEWNQFIHRIATEEKAAQAQGELF